MSARRSRVLLLALCITTTACGSWGLPGLRGRSGTTDGPWQAVVTAQPVETNRDLCRSRWETARPPDGPSDRIGLDRLSRCVPRSDAQGAALLYLPGTHMNGSLAVLDEDHDFRLYLARRGVTVWSLDYRTHFVDPMATDLDFMAAWTGEVFLEDVGIAFDFVRRAERRPAAPDAPPVLVAGFSRGASFAYALASRRGVTGDAEQSPAGPAGLIILDGVAPGMLSLPGREGPRPVAMDIGSQRLPFARRQALLATVIANPQAPSPDPDFPTAGHLLAYILYTSRAFGGHGGLSDALHGGADIEIVARLLASYDRYWPSAATPEAWPHGAAGPATEGATTHPDLPVFAVASTNIGAVFTRAVEESARAFDADATVVALPGRGHLDVLVGVGVRDSVFAPLRAWIGTYAPGP